VSHLRTCVQRYLLIPLLLFSGLLPVAVLRREPRTTARAATTFVVNNVNDSGPGSLRQAMIDTNANPGLDTIVFNVGRGHKTIRPMSRLPSLTDPVVIDGSTQPGFSGFPIIEIDSAYLVEGSGLHLAGGDSTVRSLVINRSYFDGIAFGLKGGNRVEGCYLGTDVSGTIPRPNGGNGISAPSSNNIIGGTTAATRNVISGNNWAGIDISRACCTGDESPITGNVIRGNYIGVNAAGSAAIPNQREGIRMSSVNANVPVTGNFVGGTDPGAGNVVSGNHFDGVDLDGFHLSNNTVQGNFIGTDATGNFAIPNDGSGLVVTGSSNLIGGSSAGARNVISGNGRAGSGVSGGTGVELGTRPGNIVQGNVIGMNAATTAPIPNLEHGLALGGTNSVIGGVNPGEGNVIAFNGYDGIVDATPSSAGNTFRGNSIFSNGYNTSNANIGIDIGGLGVTPNDAGDADTGTNNLQNFPVITSVTAAPNSVNVKGTLNSTASTSFILDFYANSLCDPTGFGEGARFIGSATVISNSAGDASFDVNFPIALASAEVLTATATDPVGNTSEFSQCSVASAPSSGIINFSPTSVLVNEADGVASFTLIRTGGSAGSLSVSFSAVNQTATAGLDFTPAQGTLTFADGETSKMFTVPILEDNLDEASETARVRLSTSGNLDTLGTQSTATLTITDNDPLPGLSVSDVSVYEGNSGHTIMYLVVNLSAVSGRTVTATFATENGTASPVNDYNATGGGVIFNPGESSRTFFVRVFGDTETEVDETFLVNLTSVSGATAVRGQGIATILNDDGNTTPLQLMFEEIGSNPIPAAALDSVLFLRDPFQVVNSSNLLNQGADRNTRIIVFVTNLQLAAGENSSAVTVNLFDSSNQNYDVTAEDVRTVPGFSSTQVIFRLPDNLSPGKCMIKVKAHGQSSNSGTLTITP
jgi:hypothetical protein